MAADPVTNNTVEDLFNYDIDSDDPFGERVATKPRDDKQTLSPRAAKRRAGADDADGFGLDLGLDQEVKIKKRKPNPKLDEALLLSKPGIPKLRALARDGISKKLRLKGKGHEFSDAAKLLNFFQLWLDDLYPRAKFADGLQMVEKVGHSKRMQVMRREWINESKRKDLYDDDMYGGQSTGDTTKEAVPNNPPTNDEDPSRPHDEAHPDDMFFPDANRKPDTAPRDEPDDDELDALLAEHSTVPQATRQKGPLTEDSEGDDDLDTLLAEAERPRDMPKHRKINEEDELDALLAEQELRQSTVPAIRSRVDDEGADLDALLAPQEARLQETSRLKEPVNDDDDVDLDALMA